MFNDTSIIDLLNHAPIKVLMSANRSNTLAINELNEATLLSTPAPLVPGSALDWALLKRHVTAVFPRAAWRNIAREKRMASECRDYRHDEDEINRPSPDQALSGPD